MQVHDLLLEAVKHCPEKEAVWYDNRWLTYGEIGAMSEKVSAFLARQNVSKGDRVAILLDNSFFYIAAYFGILRAGAVAVGISTDVNGERLSYLLSDSGALSLISQKKFVKLIAESLDSVCDLRSVLLEEDDAPLPSSGSLPVFRLYSDLVSDSDSGFRCRTIDIDLAEIVYTSGSTGKPKGVMLSHLNLISNMKAICTYLKLTEADRVMVVLPFNYIYGKSLLLTHFMVRASLVIDNRFVFPNKVLETMEQTGVTGFAGVPSTFMILLNHSMLKKRRFASLRYVTQAGGAMAPSVQKEVAEAFSPAGLYIMYGATEAAPRLSYLEPELLLGKSGSIGIPVDNVDLLVCDPQGMEVPRGEVGEIAARGSNIMNGYWNDPAETSRVLKKGMYFTGDLGREDEDGFFYVVGRTKEMIKVKGFRVGVKEIEDAILELNEVEDTAVVGVDDPILGEAIVALVIPRTKGWEDRDKIRKHLVKKLPLISQPSHIEFYEQFPKNSSGKIMKAELKERENRKRKVNVNG